MRSRSRLLVALAPALLAVGLGGASPAQATPAAVTVEVAHHVEAAVTLADGRQAGMVVDEYPSGGPAGRWTEVALTVACESVRDCATGGDSMVDLDGYALTGIPGLGRSTLPAQQRTLYGWTDRGATQVATPVTYGARFTGTGPVTTSTARAADCTATCRTVVVTTTRAVTVALTVDGVTSTGTGTVSSTRTVGVVAPR